MEGFVCIYRIGAGGLFAVSEQRAGYYVSTQDRPAFITDLSPHEIDEIFDLMHADHARWHGSNGNRVNGNGKSDAGSGKSHSTPPG